MLFNFIFFPWDEYKTLQKEKNNPDYWSISVSKQCPTPIILILYFSVVMVGAAVQWKIENSNIWPINHKRNVIFFPFISKLLGLWESFATGLTEPQLQGFYGRKFQLWRAALSSLTGHSVFPGILWAPGNSAPYLNLSVSVRKPHKSGLDLDLKVGQNSDYWGSHSEQSPSSCLPWPGRGRKCRFHLWVQVGSDFKQPLGLYDNFFNSRTCSLQTYRFFFFFFPPARGKADNEVAESEWDWFCLTLVFSIYSPCHCPLDIFMEAQENAPFMY